MGIENKKQDVDRLTEVLRDILSVPRSPVNLLLADTHNGTPVIPRSKEGIQIEGFASTIVKEVFG